MKPSTAKKCSLCDNMVETNRHKYCSDCSTKVKADSSRKKQDGRLKGCMDCGLPNKGRGSRFCEECRIKRLPLWQQAERQRSQKRRANAANERENKVYRCLECEEPVKNYRFTYCESCTLLRKAERTRNRRAKNPEKARQLDKKRLDKKRQKRIESGEFKPIFLETQKWCSRCETYKDFSDFGPDKKSSRNLQTYCKVCSNEYAFSLRIKKIYGITVDEYYNLLEEQDGKCAICQNKPKKQRLAVDHDHKTGLIRGLLCTRCNHKLLGSAKDNIEVLKRAVSYLENPPASDKKWVVP